MDTAVRGETLSCVRFGNQTYVNLPFGKHWRVELTVVEDTVCQVSWELMNPALQVDTSLRTAEIHAYRGERMTMDIPAQVDGESSLTLRLSNGT